jgi:hypothetical protein
MFDNEIGVNQANCKGMSTSISQSQYLEMMLLKFYSANNFFLYSCTFSVLPKNVITHVYLFTKYGAFFFQ